jgi:hypothetical protein
VNTLAYFVGESLMKKKVLFMGEREKGEERTKKVKERDREE